MEQITRRDGAIYYGEQRCVDVDEAYERFRADYHKILGRAVYKRLDRLGRRTERIHECGFILDSGGQMDSTFDGTPRVRYTMALVIFCYCRIVGSWDMLGVTDDNYDDWLFHVFSKGSKCLRLTGKADKSGRTGKRLKTRYK